MSIANGTTHYGYPQVQLTDRPTFADFNPAFQDIDAKLYGLITGAATDHSAIEALQTGLGETNLAVASVKDTADAAKAKADANEENIGILQTSLGNTDRTVATKLDSVAIAEPYDASAGTYAVGDVVVYNGQRYRCTTAVAVAEPFDADKWTGEDVETVLEQLSDDVSSLVHYTDVVVSLNATSWTNQATGIDTSVYDVIGWSFNYTDNIYTAIASGSAPSLTYNRTNNELTVYNPYAAAIALSVRVAYITK